MKYLLFLVLICANGVQAQSQKKRFATLNKEFGELKYLEDSLSKVNRANIDAFDLLKQKVSVEITEIEQGIRKSEQLDSIISVCFDKTSKLELDFAFALKESMDVFEMRNLFNSALTFFNANNPSNSVLTVVDEAKIKEQKSYKSKNELIIQYIAVLTRNIEILRTDIQSNKTLVVEGKLHVTQIVQQKNNLDDENSRKSDIIPLINRELTRSKSNFEKNGPKGFSKEYFEVFPDVFPNYLSKRPQKK